MPFAQVCVLAYRPVLVQACVLACRPALVLALSDQLITLEIVISQTPEQLEISVKHQ